MAGGHDDRRKAPNPAPAPSFQRPAKRPRVVVACQRCKTRRQKCDNQLPACSNCARAKLNCVFAEHEYPSSYVKALENRIALLETQLGSNAPETGAGSSSCLGSREGSREGEGATGQAAATGLEATAAPNLANSVGLLSLHAAAEPQYFGVSSGVSLALMIETAVYEKARPSSNLSLPAESTASPFSSYSPRAPTTTAPLPSPEKGATFIDAYLSHIHPNFPFLAKQKLWETHQNRGNLEDAAADEARHDCAMLQLVYAIGSRCLQLVGSVHAAGLEPEGQYCSAMVKIQDQLNVPSVQNIQIILLVAIYALRCPSGSSVWHLCGLMIRQCLELGLHRQLRTEEKSTNSGEFKRRLFWSIYHLERRTALVLGRPLAITDDEIDISLPHHVEDDTVEGPPEPSETLQDHQISNSNSRPGGSPTTAEADISFHVHMIRLDQLNTKSRLTLCRLAKAGPGANVDKKIAKRFQELEDWKTTIFGSSAAGGSVKQSAELMWCTARTPVQTPMSRPALSETRRLALLLNYHRARRMLLQTILTDVRLPSQAFPFSSFAKSSGEVCQLNRRLHRLKSVPFTLLDLHSVFVAGFSMVYCAWTDPELYDAEMAADFGACSTVLYLIAEQWGAGAKKYRDAFELVAGKTAEYALGTRRSREAGQQWTGSVGQQGPSSSVAPTSEYVLGGPMPHQSNDTYDMGPTPGGSQGWPTENFDAWQMMTQFVQTQDCDLECDAVNFTEIEEFLAGEGLGWFNGGTSIGP